MKKKIGNEKELEKIAKDLWETVSADLGKRAMVFALEGPLGAGKTVFIKALAKAAGIKEEVVSPTFVLHIPHKIKLKVDNGQLTIGFEHIDCWRMEEFGELEQIGIRKMVENKSIIVIEWADKFEEEIKKLSDEVTKIIWVKIEYGSEEDERTITITNF